MHDRIVYWKSNRNQRAKTPYDIQRNGVREPSRLFRFPLLPLKSPSLFIQEPRERTDCLHSGRTMHVSHSWALQYLRHQWYHRRDSFCDRSGGGALRHRVWLQWDSLASAWRLKRIHHVNFLGPPLWFFDIYLSKKAKVFKLGFPLYVDHELFAATYKWMAKRRVRWIHRIFEWLQVKEACMLCILGVFNVQIEYCKIGSPPLVWSRIVWLPFVNE